MRARKLVIGSGLLLAVATSVPALAQPASTKVEPFAVACTNVPASESERAHKLYEAGKAYYDDATYDAAIVQFREAYKKDCTKHELLVIISRAYELKGDKAAAIAALETYLERAPTSPDAAQHRNRIENLRKQLAAQPAATPTTAAPPPSATTTTAPPVEVREHTVPPWIVVGLGAAVAVTGVVLLVAKPNTGCNLDTNLCTKEASETPTEFKQRQNDAVREKSWGIAGPILIAGGGAILVGGLLWHFLEPSGPVEKTGKAKPRVNPEVAPGFAGVSFGGTF